MPLHTEAKDLHRRSMIIDGLNVSRWGDAEVYRHLHEGGFTAINATVAVWEGTKQTLQNIGRFYRDFETYSEWVRPVASLADLHAAKRETRVGIVFGFQNSSPIEDDLRLVEVFHRLGVRVIQLGLQRPQLRRGRLLRTPGCGLEQVRRGSCERNESSGNGDRSFACRPPVYHGCHRAFRAAGVVQPREPEGIVRASAQQDRRRGSKPW